MIMRAGESKAEAGALDPQTLDRLAQLFHVLADKTRLNILLLLAEGERNVTSLCDELRLPQPTVSHHLGLLRIHHLVAGRRAGKQIFYGLDGRATSPEGSLLAFEAGGFTVRIASGGEAEE